MGHPNDNNRSSALTPEIAGKFNADLITAVKEAFEAGVVAGRQEVLLSIENRIARGE
jgi:hypothetical protein